MRKFLIIVEGEADKKFMLDFYQHLFHEKAPMNSIIHTGDLIKDEKKKSGGKDKLTHEVNIRQMQENTDWGGVNLVIFDADKNPEARREELLSVKEKYGVEFNVFLFPNNVESGELEKMLEHIIKPSNEPIFKCWEEYEKKLVQLEIPGRTPPPLTAPAKKTKIYAYLEALLGERKSQKEFIKEVNRDYENTLHWNLDAEYLEPLKEFLLNNLK